MIMAVNDKTDLTIADYEELFKDRYTEADPEFLQTISKPLDDPPCVKNWFVKQKRNDWGNRNYGQRDNRDRNYDNRGRNYDNRKRSYDNRGASYDNRGGGYDNRDRRYDNNRGYDNRNRGYDNRDRGYDNRDRGYDRR